MRYVNHVHAVERNEERTNVRRGKAKRKNASFGAGPVANRSGGSRRDENDTSAFRTRRKYTRAGRDPFRPRGDTYAVVGLAR